MHTLILTLIAVPLYCSAGILLALRLTGRIPVARFSNLRILSLALLAMALHLGVLYQHMLTPVGINFSFFNAISLMTWLLALLLLVLSAVHYPIENLGIAVLPMAALGLALEEVFPSERLLDLGSNMLDIHIILSVGAYTFLSLAALQAILLAIQDKHLREKHPGGFIRALPPLQHMERLLFQLIATGFVLQSLSLASGFPFLNDMFGQHMVHKTFFSVAAWLVFAVLLWGRWRFGWRGRTAIRWTLTGFLFLLLAYVGSRLVLELLIEGRSAP